MSTGPLTAPRSTPPVHPRGMGIAERSYESGWRAGASAMLLEALRAGVSIEVLQRLQAIIDAGPQKGQP